MPDRPHLHRKSGALPIVGNGAFGRDFEPMAKLALTSNSRVMLIAPHPDDEALACSVVLQRAMRVGASVRVVYATDGENNPWPQRAIERRWRIGAVERKRWGKIRRKEALSALRALGLEPSRATFLGLPDQGLTSLLTTNCQFTRDWLLGSIRGWLPTHLLIPSIFDTHPDHNALGVMVRSFGEDLGETSVWSYIVHGRSAAFFERARVFPQSRDEAKIKVAAILQHRTQTKLSGKRFLSYANRPERFLELSAERADVIDAPVRRLARTKNFIRFQIKIVPRLIRPSDASLFLLGRDRTGKTRCLETCLPVGRSRIRMLSSEGDLCAAGRYHGHPFAGEFTISTKMFHPAHPLFLKAQRRSIFFDQSGWIEIPPFHPYLSCDSSSDSETYQLVSQFAT